jgi:long-subunit fatty acid transport protein
VLASGLDLDLIHGTRYISLGGNQVAIAKDAYAPFYNPAGMTSVESGTFALNLNNLVHQYGAPIGADNAQRKSQWNWGPLFYMGGVYRALDRLALGFAVFPTALQGGKFSPVDYGPAGTPLSNLELSNKLVRIEAAPTIAVKVIEHLSLGLSYRIAYTRYDKAGGIFSSVAGANAVHFDSTLTGWDFDTFKAGLMLDNWYGFSAALTYRTEGKVKLTGDTTVTTFLGADRVHAEQELNLPSQIQFGLSYDWLPKKLMTAFTYEYTINNVLETDTMTTAHPLVPVVSVPIYYRNGHSFHLGSEYVFNLSGDQNLRTGVGGVLAKTFTQSRYANAILPPASSYLGGALGAQYEVEHQTFGWSFNYGRYEKRVAAVDPTLAGQSFAGKYALDVYLISVDYQYHF